jgi:O-phosphoseryl-tRNA(Cys) synthetase
MYHYYFPEEFPVLQKEIAKYHPDLRGILERQEDKSLEVQLAEIALYLNIAVDGDYLVPDLCRLFIKHLQNKRVLVITNL